MKLKKEKNPSFYEWIGFINLSCACVLGVVMVTRRLDLTIYRAAVFMRTQHTL